MSADKNKFYLKIIIKKEALPKLMAEGKVVKVGDEYRFIDEESYHLVEIVENKDEEH